MGQTYSAPNVSVADTDAQDDWELVNDVSRLSNLPQDAVLNTKTALANDNQLLQSQDEIICDDMDDMTFKDSRGAVKRHYTTSFKCREKTRFDQNPAGRDKWYQSVKSPAKVKGSTRKQKLAEREDYEF